MRGERTAASGQGGVRAFGKTMKMRALTLKSKPGSKRRADVFHLRAYKHSDCLSLSKKKESHYKG